MNLFGLGSSLWTQGSRERVRKIPKRTWLLLFVSFLFSLMAWLALPAAQGRAKRGEERLPTQSQVKAELVPLSRREAPSSRPFKAQGDSIWGFDCEGPSGDNQCLGVEFDGTNFHITGDNSGTDPNKVYTFDRDGNYLSSFDQFRSSGFGWRDLAWDGSHLYASDDNWVTEFSTDGGDYGDFPGPENPNRALAYDPATDHFWTANWNSNIYEFDRTGTVIHQYANTYSAYGMAWDTVSPGGPWLWVSAQAPDMVYQFNPSTGAYTGVSFGATYAAGGCAFSNDWDPAYSILFYLAQAGGPDHDHVTAYEILFAPLAHDVAVESIESPGLGVPPNAPLTPRARVRNRGLNLETFDVACSIDSSGGPVYTDTQTVISLPSDSTRLVDFVPDWTPNGPGSAYTVSMYTLLAGDEYPHNDTLCQLTITHSYYEDFEASNGEYVADPATGAWEWGVPTSGPGTAHSGANLWATVLTGNYSNNANWKLDSRDMVAILENPALEFWHWYDIETGGTFDWDGGNVKLSTDGGITWQTRIPIGGYPGIAHSSNAGIPGEPCYTGNSGGWQLAHFDLAAIASGQPFRLRFHFGSDPTTTYPGWYLDDIYGLGFQPTPLGWIDGTVSELMGAPLPGAIVTVLTAGATDTTNGAGYYNLEVPSATHDMHVEAFGYNFVDTTGIVVTSPETTRVNFELTHPEILVEPTSFYVELNAGGVTERSLYITNNGNGPLLFEIVDQPSGLGRLEAQGGTPERCASLARNKSGPASLSRTPPGWEPPVPLYPGEIVEQHPAVGDEPTGFEFDETNRCFWQGAWDNYVYRLDTNFVQTGQYPEFGSTLMPPTGLAWYEGYLYQANYRDGRVYKISVSTWTAVDTIQSPGGQNLLGVEWVEDRLWLTDDDEFLYECDSLGNLLNQYITDDLVPFGLAYLPVLDTLYLCGWQAGNIYAVDPHTGSQHIAFPTPGSPGNYSCSGASYDNRYPAYVWIAHQGDRQLYLTDTGNDAVPWLSADPVSGVVPGGESCTVTVTFDATGFSNDTTVYANLLIRNNSQTPEVVVPCTLLVHYVGIKEASGPPLLPRAYALFQNSPNPAAGSTTISYQLPVRSQVSLRVYSLTGQLVRYLLDACLLPGSYAATWDGRNSSGRRVSSGVYFLRLSARPQDQGQARTELCSSFEASRKMVLFR